MLNLAKVFSLVDSKVLPLKEASKLLNYSYWRFTRLYKKFLKEGLGNLFVRERKRKDEDVELLKNYYISLGKPQTSLLSHFLHIDYPEFPKISHEWMRKILIRESVYCLEERKKLFRKRFEAPYPGVLVQGDSSMRSGYQKMTIIIISVCFYSYIEKRTKLRCFPEGTLSICIDAMRARWKKLTIKRSSDKSKRKGNEEFAIL